MAGIESLLQFLGGFPGPSGAQMPEPEGLQLDPNMVSPSLMARSGEPTTAPGMGMLDSPSPRALLQRLFAGGAYDPAVGMAAATNPESLIPGLAAAGVAPPKAASLGARSGPPTLVGAAPAPSGAARPSSTPDPWAGIRGGGAEQPSYRGGPGAPTDIRSPVQKAASAVRAPEAPKTQFIQSPRAPQHTKLEGGQLTALLQQLLGRPAAPTNPLTLGETIRGRNYA